MNPATYPHDWPDIDVAFYNRSVKLFSTVKHLLNVKIELYADTQTLQGDIFLFNHFSRFETFIPQFLIFDKTGAYSCAIAAGRFFSEENILSNYLQHVGVYPHDHPRLFAMLVGQILRGRKVIIFPEGEMVKDRRVIDKHGRYSVFSRITGNRRKLHTGAAVLGQGVEVFKATIRHAFKEHQIDRLQHWKELLRFDSLDELIAASFKPTLIVPANITFYPIRSSENLLFKSAELFSDKLSQRQSEELLIEGNIILKDTDMDIRMGSPINSGGGWGWFINSMVHRVVQTIHGPDDVFSLSATPRNWQERLLGHYLIKNAKHLRDQYMRAIYANVTINLSHLASTLIMSYMDARQPYIEKNRFYAVLYIAIKYLQKNTAIHLHRSLLNPDDYGNLLHGINPLFERFIGIAKEAELLAEQEERYHFLPKLCADYSFDQIRLENPIAVYNNEAAPLRAVREALLRADQRYPSINPYQMAAWQFEDEQRALVFEQRTYSVPDDIDIKRRETATADPSPFFIKPKQPNGFGILLIHGLLASPAEVRDYGHYLAAQDFTVLGVRLKGHGTSPYALRGVSFEQWFETVQRGFNILKVHCAKLFVIGFSTGGALGLELAAENHAEIIGLVAISVPVKFANPAFMLVPLLHNTIALVRWVPAWEDFRPFIEHVPEHPDINYFSVPIHALYELRRLIQHLETRLPTIETPTLLLYADHDPVVLPESSEIVFEKLGSIHKHLRSIKSERHGILMENIGGTWSVIDDFLSRQRQESLSGS